MNHRAAFSFQTTHGNPVCAAAALAVLEAIDRDDLVGNAADVGFHLMQGLELLKQKHSLIGDVRGLGLAVGIELVSDRMNKAPAKLETTMTVYRAFELGLVIYYVGVNSNVLELTPPLTLTKEEASTGLDLLDRALADVTAGRIDPAVVEAFQGW